MRLAATRPKAKTIAQDEGFRDRKSTRLNSSHQIISYAVFCLKKKKNSPKPTRTLRSCTFKTNSTSVHPAPTIPRVTHVPHRILPHQLNRPRTHHTRARARTRL